MQAAQRGAPTRERSSTGLAIGRGTRRGALPRDGGAETNRDGAGVPAALRVPDARCGRRRVRLRVRGGPGDASRRLPAMRARGGPTATAGQEAASARATGGAVRAPKREALRGPSRPTAVRDVRGRAATMTRRAPRTASSPASSRRHPGLRGLSSQARGRHGSDDAAAEGPATTVDEARTVALAQVIRPDHHMLAREPLIVFGSVAGAMGPCLTPRPPIAAGAPCPHSRPG